MWDHLTAVSSAGWMAVEKAGQSVADLVVQTVRKLAVLLDYR